MQGFGRARNPTTRIPNSSLLHSSSSCVTKTANGDISGTKRGIIDPLVLKRPKTKSEKVPKKFLKKFWKKVSDKKFWKQINSTTKNLKNVSEINIFKKKILKKKKFKKLIMNKKFGFLDNFFLDFLTIFFGFLVESFWILGWIFVEFLNILMQHCVGHRPERPKGSKPARRATTLKSGPGGAPRLLVAHICHRHSKFSAGVKKS